MRPRVRSYGESSTATLSPGRMRIKFFRILPETCASTWCLFSNSTRNMAFGSGSRTTAITSIASSLLIKISSQLPVLSSQLKALGSQLRTENWELLSSLRQNHRPIFCYRDAMLEVRAETAVRCHSRPLVAEHARLRLAEIHHGLNCQHHTFSQLCAMTARSEVRDLRLFMQFRPDPVSHEFANHAESGSFHVFLHRRSNVSHRVADAHLL